jgi:ADP-ribosyl-[dinitrogen reductase] hydrolase
MTSISLTSRIHGTIYGVAVTDALGGPVEFKRRGTFSLVDSMLPNDHFDLPPGCFTDDTSMALCLSQSLISKNGCFDIQDQIRKYISWSRMGYMSSVPSRGCFDIGIATSGTLKIWEDYFRLNPSMVDDVEDEAYKARVAGAQKLVDGMYARKDFRGNGSLMRVAPVGLVYHADMDQAVRFAKESSKPTHPNGTCVDACGVYTALVVRALRGESREELAEALAGMEIEDVDLRARLSRYKRLSDWEDTASESIKSTGFVIDTLEAALWAFFTTSSFRDGAIKVVNLGNDADTVGAVYGGLSGAWHGFDAIPEEWIKEMRSRELLDKAVEGICWIAEANKA